MKKQTAIIRVLILSAILLCAGIASAFTANFAFTIAAIVNSFTVPWTGSYTTNITGAVDQAVYLKGTSFFSACDTNSSLWDSNIALGSLDFTATGLDENGMDLKLQIAGVDRDINSAQTNYSFPITAVGQRVCLKAIGKNNGAVKITTSDFNIVEG